MFKFFVNHFPKLTHTEHPFLVSLEHTPPPSSWLSDIEPPPPPLVSRIAHKPPKHWRSSDRRDRGGGKHINLSHPTCFAVVAWASRWALLISLSPNMARRGLRGGLSPTSLWPNMGRDGYLASRWSTTRFVGLW